MLLFCLKFCCLGFLDVWRGVRRDLGSNGLLVSFLFGGGYVGKVIRNVGICLSLFYVYVFSYLLEKVVIISRYWVI